MVVTAPRLNALLHLPDNRHRNIRSMNKISLAGAADSPHRVLAQRVVGEANGNLFKMAKGIGSTMACSRRSERTFLILRGHLTILLRTGSGELDAGDLFVPARVEHCLVAESECISWSSGRRSRPTPLAESQLGAPPATRRRRQCKRAGGDCAHACIAEKLARGWQLNESAVLRSCSKTLAASVVDEALPLPSNVRVQRPGMDDPGLSIFNSCAP